VLASLRQSNACRRLIITIGIVVDLKAANHTNRELELMLAGKKPLAWFYDEISVLPHEKIIPEARFSSLYGTKRGAFRLFS